MKRQKGQSILEFAVVLPLFLFLAIGSIFFGMVFADYVALNSIASRTARAASLSSSEENTVNLPQHFSAVRKQLSTQSLPTKLYKWDYQKDENVKLEYEEATKSVVVTVAAQADETNAFYAVAANLLPAGSLRELKIVYRMYCDFQPDSTGK